jgi:transposase
MSLYGGIDLHANNSVVVFINEQDEVLYRKRLPNELSTILEQVAPYQTALKGLVVESTYHWYWLVDGFMEAGYRVHLANPAAMQQYEGLKYTDDHSDARWLAHLLGIRSTKGFRPALPVARNAAYRGNTWPSHAAQDGGERSRRGVRVRAPRNGW